ncbi:helix-turn-helix domain-containing protein [Streptococcus cuniculipharyngis]|uniref:Helix-turn-helix transcriptional regulator n=1 Tax=Streptococcus cuniculipharyngis TaxID=1562651 RepID=A0A5C5SGU6_9STRE|nr:helix-turn-helix transcriptional regulator [Streptococcus cuniculipharyngis]TWS99165.1 helix-turn-helix transcriptional regulator [Streptococcus cuniculipharyngis]
MTYGERIRKLREERQMSLRDLSEKSLIDYTVLSRVENDFSELTVAKAKAIARGLGCALSDIVGN